MAPGLLGGRHIRCQRCISLAESLAVCTNKSLESWGRRQSGPKAYQTGRAGASVVPCLGVPCLRVGRFGLESDAVTPLQLYVAVL